MSIHLLIIISPVVIGAGRPVVGVREGVPVPVSAPITRATSVAVPVRRIIRVIRMAVASQVLVMMRWDEMRNFSHAHTVTSCIGHWPRRVQVRGRWSGWSRINTGLVARYRSRYVQIDFHPIRFAKSNLTISTLLCYISLLSTNTHTNTQWAITKILLLGN